MKKRLKELRWQIGVPVIRMLSFLLGDMPRRPLIALGQAFGLIAYTFSGRDRRRAHDHLEMAFPALSEKSIGKIVRNAFENLSIGIMEALVLHRWSKDYIKSLIVNFEELEEIIARCKEKGAVLVTGHVGNWELLAAAFSRYGGKIHVVGRRMQEENFDSFLTKLREASGLTVLYSDGSPKEMLKALRKGTSIGILPDQDITEVEGIFVEFFGKDAYTPTAPAKLAISAKTDLYVILLVREGEKFRLFINKSVEASVKFGSEEKQEGVLRITREWTKMLENVIRRYPDQWVWMHRRWRNTPERIAWRRANKRLDDSDGKA